MFTGIIEALCEITQIEESESNKIFTLTNPYKGEIYIDQSISHNGACLTVIEFNDDTYKVEAIRETLERTNLSSVQEGDIVNLERSLLPSSRVDGHFVQGHVDCTGTVKSITDKNGSWELAVNFPESYALYLIEKGSVCLNGISLTITGIQDNYLTVDIIPYTFEHTNVKNLSVGSLINIEFDSLGKYVVNYLKKTNS